MCIVHTLLEKSNSDILKVHMFVKQTYGIQNKKNSMSVFTINVLIGNFKVYVFA